MHASDWIALAEFFVGTGMLGLGSRKLHGVGQMAEDWRGRPKRLDPMTGAVIDPGRASMPGRIAALEAELHPNHGTSMHDQLSKLAGEFAQFRREHASAQQTGEEP